MIKSNCEHCGAEITRGGYKPGRFCSFKCKGEWQQTQKPVDEAWLRQKYLAEKLSSAAISKIVNRNQKQVYAWLIGYGIPTRQRGRHNRATDRVRQSQKPAGPHYDREWLYEQYVVLLRPANDIAKECGVTDTNIYHFLKKFGIPRRDMSTIRKAKHWGMRGKANSMSGRTGDTNPNYKDGSSPERQRIYASGDWKEILRVVYARDAYHCRRCGSPKTQRKGLHAHHIKPWAGNKELRFDLDNLVTLCRDCHEWVHSRENTEREYLD